MARIVTGYIDPDHVAREDEIESDEEEEKDDDPEEQSWLDDSDMKSAFSHGNFLKTAKWPAYGPGKKLFISDS